MEHAEGLAALFLPLQEGRLGATMRTSPFLYPLCNVLHIFGFVLLAGSIVTLDLRVLGIARGVPLPVMARLNLRLAAAGLALALVTGFLVFSADAAHVAGNPAFRIKVTLIALGLANIALAHLGPWRRLATWGAEVPARARAHAAFSILLWFAAIAAGRMIAYF
jgi:hypothetical protein